MVSERGLICVGDGYCERRRHFSLALLSDKEQVIVARQLGCGERVAQHKAPVRISRDLRHGRAQATVQVHGDRFTGDEVLAERYRSKLKSWYVVDLDSEIAESAARLRASLKLKLADSVQAASALAIGADALVTHDRDFSPVRNLRILGVS